MRRVLVVVVAAGLAACAGGTPAAGPLDEMIRAAGATGRPIAGRLSGAPHTEPRSVMRSDSSLTASTTLDTLRFAAAIQRRAADDPSADNLHQLGISFLLLGELEKAVQLLEDSVQQAPNPRVLSDLAAAYLELSAAGRPEMLPPAVEAADRAIRGAPPSHDARFNLALALERLHLPREALTVWTELRADETQPGWRDEAARRATGLEHVVARAKTSGAIPAAADQLLSNPSSLRALFQKEADSAFRDTLLVDWLERQVLPAWARATLDGRSALAASHLAAVQSLLDAGMAGGVDGEAGELVARCLRPHPLAAARAIDAYERGLTGPASGRTAALREAAGFGASRCRPLALSAELELAWLDYSDGNSATARAGLSRLIPRAEAARADRVVASARRARAMTDLMEQRNADAVQDLQRAAEAARRVGDLILLGRILNNLADVLDVEGRGRESWEARLGALDLASRFDGDRLATSVYGSAGLAAARNQQTRLGLAFVDAESAQLGAGSSPLSRLLLESRRAELTVGRRDAAATRQSLERAEQLGTVLKDDPRVPLLMTLMAPPRASLVAEAAGTGAALAEIDKALTVLNGRVPSRIARLRLIRARLLAQAGDTTGATRELSTVIALFQQVSGASLGDRLEASTTRELTNVARVLVEELLARGQAEAALDVWTTVGAGLNGDAGDLRNRVPRGTALLQYTVLSDQVVGWLTVENQLQVVRTGLAEVKRAKIHLDTAVLQGAKRADLDASFAALFDLLIRPLQPHLGSVNRLIVIPDDVLTALPFGSFRDQAAGRYLFESMSVAMAWGVPHQAMAPTLHAFKDALVVSDPGGAAASRPALTHARAEADTIAGLYPSSTLLPRDRATARRSLTALAAADVVHWAGHAVVDDSDGRRSYFAVAPEEDGVDRLTADRIAAVKMRAGSVVVLAACRSIDAPYRAFHARSLAHAFHRAGASNVVGVAWDIPDAQAQPFFEALHRQLAGGRQPMEALRVVQREFVNRDPQSAGVALAAGAYVR